MDNATFAASMFGAPPDAAASPEAASAGLPPTTADTTSPDEPESVSAAEALAALDGPEPPQDTATPEDAPEVAATPSELDQLRAERDALLAEQETVKAQAADDAFVAEWSAHWERGYAFYDQERQRIAALGAQQGRSQDEIDLAIYRRVELGDGLLDPHTGQPVMGEKAWERATAENERLATAQYASQKSAPSHVEATAAKYALTETQRTSLAKFTNFPPDAVEEIARTFAAQNSTATTQQQQIVHAAAQQLRGHLSQQTAPGAPGRPAPKVVRFEAGQDHANAEFVARSLNLIGRRSG